MSLPYTTLRLFSGTKMRMPTIKFRHGIRKPDETRGPIAASAASGQSAQGIVVEDIQLPIRFKRPDMSQEEIEYINRGGPA